MTAAKCIGCNSHVDPNFSFMLCSLCNGLVHHNCCSHSSWDETGKPSDNVVAEFLAS